MGLTFGAAIKLVEQELLLLREDIVAGQAERWERVLSAMARHHSYCIENVLLIEMQRPSSTEVRSEARWNQHARRVREPTPPILIIDRPADDPRRLAFGEHWLHRFYIPPPMVEVFDVGQTSGQFPDRPERSYGRPLGSAGQLLDWTERFAARLDIEVIYDRLDGSNGYSLGGVVVAERRLDRTERFRQLVSLLAQELARAHPHSASGPLPATNTVLVACIASVVIAAATRNPLLEPPPPPPAGDELGILALTGLFARVQSTASIILDGLQAELAEDLPV